MKTVPLIIVSAVLAACSSTESDWNKAQAANTEAAYQDFLKQHPDGAHAQEAHSRIQKIEDDQAWSDAQKSNTLEAYQQYLQKEPNGAHTQDAQTQITSLERAAAWKNAQAANTQSALQDFLQKYSTGPEADQARAQLQKLQSEGYRVQLATFRKQNEAEKSRDSLKTRLASELQEVEVVPPAGSEKLYRVASGPMTEADAKSTCAKLKKAHQHCEVVKG
jgi:outer membrane protein assembly factor BamD (BamD/ComL family)